MFSANSSFETIPTYATWLYEQERENPKGFSRLGLYVRRWVRWAGDGLVVYKKNPAGAGNFLVQACLMTIFQTAFRPIISTILQSPLLSDERDQLVTTRSGLSCR